MEEYRRTYPLLSLCGLNCALCSMYLGKYCPGCGGGKGNQPCKITRCSREHGEVEFCYLCEAYPCDKYEGIDAYDSFITHQNQLKDLEKASRIGIEAYRSQLEEKAEILDALLSNYNDGRRKTFFCVAVNLLELEDLKAVLEQLHQDETLPLKEKAKKAVALFQEMAAKRGLVLKLRKKPK